MKRVSARLTLGAALVAVVGTLSLTSAPAASAAGFGVEEFLAGTCTVATCSKESTLSELFTQAAGHPNYGITDFKIASTEVGGAEVPLGVLKRVRVDLPAGLSVNPTAVPLCPMPAFESIEVSEGVYGPSACEPATIVGKDYVTVVVEPLEHIYADVPLEGDVYNLEQPEKVPAEFGVAIDLAPLGLAGAYAHTILEGGVSWHEEAGVSPSGDYHELFKINDVSAKLPLLESRLEFYGNIGEGGFLTLPSTCNVVQTTQIEVESYEGEAASTSFTTPIGATGCGLVPFEPKLTLTPGTGQSDRPNGATFDLEVPQNVEPEGINSSTLKTTTVTLPEGMTLNPSVANGLEACTDAEFGKSSESPVACPFKSALGSVEIKTPTLPEALKGSIYAGAPVAGKSPASGDEYRIFLNAESTRYGVAVRLVGNVSANEQTGRLTATFADNPESPFSNFILKFNEGTNGPLANPLVCGKASADASLTPYTDVPPTLSLVTEPFTVDFDGKGAACPSPLPFSIAQSTSSTPTTGGASSSFTLNLVRPEGNQYLSEVSTTLPEGVVAKIPSVPLCGEAEVAAKSCPAASAIGTATVSLGSGSKPYSLTGTVYLTGPMKSVSVKAYPSPPEGAPYGLLVLVNAEKVGPYNYGIIATKATINVDPYTARVTVSSQLPTIEGGVPLRMRTLDIAVTHENYILNPTSCAMLATESTFISTMGAKDSVSTPFQATGCESLAFEPSFKAYSNARHTRKRGASLKVGVTQKPGEASIKSVTTTLPKKLPSRESTLKHACPEATFAANPFACPAGSRVGGATAKTPVLPDELTGPIYVVSHGGRAYPDLDVVLKGDGVTFILVGNTSIKKGITHSKFLTVPDVPITSFKLKLPIGRHSILSGNGKFCKKPMYMPTTIIAQNGKKVTQKTRIHISECPVEVLKRKVKGDKVVLTVKTASAGKLGVSGKFLRHIHKTVSKGGKTKLVAKLSASGKSALRARGHIKVRIKVRFVPKANSNHASKAFVSATLRAKAAAAHFKGRG